MTATETTLESLRNQADVAAARAAAAQAAAAAAEDAERAIALEAQAKRDRAYVNAYSTRELDQHVTDTRAALEDAVRAWPVTQALAAHLAAVNARTWAYSDMQAAAGRLGRPTAGMVYPDTGQPVLVDLVATIAGRMGQAATDAARAEMEG